MRARLSGFTLVEMSIVLVIIGLIVGGILVGRDLINAAEVRATISQINKYNSAVNTFLVKYNGLPGDLRSDLAAAYGFTTRAGSQGRGDGNGIIDGINAGDDNQSFAQESAMFWNDLSVAGLIDGSFQGGLNVDSANPQAVTAAQVPTTFPVAKLGRGNYVTVSSYSGTNYWIMGGITSTSGGVGGGGYNSYLDMTPVEAYNIDIKMDDGMPNTGIVQQHGIGQTGPLPVLSPCSWPSNWQAASGAGFCTMGGANAADPAATYNRVSSTGGNTPACILRFRFN